MIKLFAKRKSEFRGKSLKYLRYVLNDHFILFLMIGLGYLVVEYANLLKNFPETTWPIWLVIMILTVIFPFWGQAATYLEKEDSYFLLVQESIIARQIKHAFIRAWLYYSVLQTFLLLLLMPLYLSLGWTIYYYVIYLVMLSAIKYVIFYRRLEKITTKQGLNWQLAINEEQARQQRWLKFFALFTNVKGISQRAKRRKYLDILLLLFKASTTWTYLLVRVWLRSGDYFGLTLRLVGLSLLSLVLVGQDVTSLILVTIFNYLFVFQLVALPQALDYQYLIHTYPLDDLEKRQSLVKLLRKFTLIIMLIQLCIVIFSFKALIWAFILVIIDILLVFVYLPYKAKKVIDEKG